MRPRIGITVPVDPAPPAPGDGPRYVVAARYALAVARAGGVPLLLPTLAASAAAPADAAAAIDGLLLSGGRGDRTTAFVDPTAVPSLRATDPERYDYEVALVRAAWSLGRPVLGVCRGYQTLVEAAGGALDPRLDAVRGSGVRHDQSAPNDEATHGLRIAPGSRLHALVGATEARVNSFHRQGVARAPDGFMATAWSEDDLIEAVEGHGGRTLGVQFHPEWLCDADPRWLAPFAALVADAAAR